MDVHAPDAVADAWRSNHRHLLDVAYRMLGSLSEAEDVVQEAFTRLLRVDLDQVDDLRGWLVVVVSRLCLDQLRSARVRREAYVGPWLPEPVVSVDESAVDPLERVTLDESVRMALLVVLERLSPAERVAFVLHDVFQYSFETVGDIVGRSPAACRQLASRARRHIRDEAGPARFDVDPLALRRAAERFIAACATGDVEALLPLLDPEVAGWTDSGGVLPAPRQSVVGRDRVARALVAWLRAFGVQLRPATVNGRPGALAYVGDELISVLSLSVHDGLIARIHAVANPAKLEGVRAGLEASQG